jgi:uncharacterized membrane protein
VSATPSASRGARITLAALVIAHAAFFSVIGILRLRSLLFGDIDLAIFTQALHSLLHGSLASSIRGASWLGDHSSLNLFLLAPVFALAPSPATLLVVQSAALALGAVPVFRLARRELGGDGPALAAAALYLASPALGYLDLFEVHPEALSTPALLAAFALLREGRVGATALWAGIALLGKEDAALAVGALGIYAFFSRRPAGARQALWLLVLAAGSLILTFGVLKPMLGGGTPAYGAMYAAWGRTPGEIALGLLRAPWRAIAALVATPGNPHDSLLKQLYWVHLLLPVAFLPLAAPGVLAIALPVVFEHLLSWRPQQHGILYQYTAFVIPFVIAATVLGVARLAAPARPVRPAAVRLLVLAGMATLVSQVLFGPFGLGLMQGARPLERYFPVAGDRTRAAEMRGWLARIPPGGVVGGFEVLPLLAGRTELHSLHHVVGGKYTFSDRPFPTPDGVVALVADFGAPRLQIYPDSGTGARLRALVDRNHLVPVAVADDRMLWVRAPGPGVSWIAPGDCDTAAAPLVYDGRLAFRGARIDPVAASRRLAFSACWERVGPIDRSYLAEWIVLDGAGVVIARQTHPIGRLIDPPADWPLGVAMRESVSVDLPVGSVPGPLRLAMRVGSARGGRGAPARASDPEVARRGGLVPLGSFTTGVAGTGSAPP